MAANPPSGRARSQLGAELTLAALQAMLTHGSEYLSVKELGRLSICAKATLNTVEAVGTWHRIFERTAQAGKVCVQDYPPSDAWGARHRGIIWNNEQGLLDCFAMPDPRIVVEVGWKRVAGCLVSKSCYHCESMASLADPFTFTRICTSCDQSHGNAWFMSKTKAKETFLLSDKDCADLPSARISSSVYLIRISDAMNASYAKYGGADGLTAEFTKRKAAAIIRYEKSQSTAKPQKKRAKIERISDRPEEDLASLKYHAQSFPISVTYKQEWDSSKLKMESPVRCQHCFVMGSTKDVEMHERLVHKVSAGNELMSPPQVCAPHKGISTTIPAVIQPAEELVQLLANAEVEYSFGRADDPVADAGSTASNAHFSFCDCKIVVDCDDTFIETYSEFNVVMWCQIKKDAVPVKLLTFGYGDCAVPHKEANSEVFKSLLEVLGLKETKSEQLVSAIITRAMSMKRFFRSFPYDYECTYKDDLSKSKDTVLYGVWTYLSKLKDGSDE